MKLVNEVGLPGPNCLLLWAKALALPVVPKFLRFLVQMFVRLVAPALLVLVWVCVKPLRTGVCCLSAADEMAATLNLATLNVNGLRMSDKRGGVFCWLWSLPVSVDVVCLQETHCVSEEECRLWFSATGLLSVVSPGSMHACGCVVLYRPHLSLVQSWKDDEGRLTFCEFSFWGKVFRVLCLYAPNRNPARDEFLERVSGRVDPSVPTLVCGDFNTVFDRGLDRSGSDPLDSTSDSSAALSRLFEDSCVFDAWRSLHPDVRAFTWMRPNGAFASRIDLIGLPVAWSASLISCDIIPCPFSDHCAVLLSTKVPDVLERGPGLWKLNCSVLSEDEYVNIISSFWSHWRSRRKSFPSVADWWERGKSRLKDLTITYCKERASRRRARRNSIQFPWYVLSII